MNLFCANCGQLLTVIRKALPKIGTIVDMVQYHKCPETFPSDFKFDFGRSKAEKVEGFDMCLRSLSSLEAARPLKVPIFDNPNKEIPNILSKPRQFGGVGTDDLRDRRFDAEAATKSTAPRSVIDQISQMANSIPSRELSEIPEGLRKDETDSVEMGD